MVQFRAVLTQNLTGKKEGWAVQRADPDGLEIVVTRIYETEQEAMNEAARLTREASRRTMS